jgi:hypothetical protein
MSSRTVRSYLADLGELVAANGVVAGHGDLLLVAGAAHAVSPAAAAVLIDPDQPHVAKRRALAVVSAAVLRNPIARKSLRQALVDDVVPRDSYPAAA